jgi:hypothetical protein
MADIYLNNVLAVFGKSAVLEESLILSVLGDERDKSSGRHSS